MLRIIGTFLLLQVVLVSLAPGWVVADFLLERGRIERELCVQRMVPGDRRTCHGECQLKKRLEHNGRQGGQLAHALRALRIGEMTVGEEALAVRVPGNGGDLAWPQLVEQPLGGHMDPMPPVPWC